MSKDRLAEFEQNVRLQNFDDESDMTILNYFSVVDMEAPYLMSFLNQVNALRGSINNISKLVDEVELLQHAMLAPQVPIGRYNLTPQLKSFISYRKKGEIGRNNVGSEINGPSNPKNNQS